VYLCALKKRNGIIKTKNKTFKTTIKNQ